MVVAPYGYKYTGDLTIPSAISYEGQQYDVDGLLYVLTAADISSLTLSEGFYQHKPVGAERGETEQCHSPSTTAKNSKISCGLGSHRLVNVNIRTDKGKTTLILDKFGIFGSDGQALEAFLAAAELPENRNSTAKDTSPSTAPTPSRTAVCSRLIPML